MKKYFLMSSLMLLLASPAFAVWYGDPGRSLENKPQIGRFVYDLSERDLRSSNAPGTTNMKSHRAYFQYETVAGRDVALAVRGLPGTGNYNFEGSGFNPHLWGAGVTARWAPRKPLGSVRFGFQAMGDVTYGAQSRDGFRNHATWWEGTLAGGATLPITDHTGIYGGVSYIGTDVEFSQGGASAHLHQNDALGGFAGVDYQPTDEGWTLGLEWHFANERAIDFMVGYRY